MSKAPARRPATALARASTPIAAVPAAAPAAKPRRLLDKSFGVASFKYNRWSAELDETQTLEHALEEHFWAGIAGKLMGQDKASPKGVGDIIEIRKRDTQQFAEVIVTAIGPGFVRVAQLRTFAPEDVSEPKSAPLTTRWSPGKKCHEVIRKNDKTVMASNFQTKADAVAWITEHVKAMAA